MMYTSFSLRMLVSLFGGGSLFLFSSVVWASGKICVEGAACYKLYLFALVMFALSVLAVVALGVSNHRLVRWFGLFVGIVNLVMGERFFSHPVYDIFYQNQTIWALQIAGGALCFAFAALQTIRLRRHSF